MRLYRAKSDRKCIKCGALIQAGRTYYGYRERALTSHEAQHAGTMYPKRHVCSPCAEKREPRRGFSDPAFEHGFKSEHDCAVEARERR